MEEDADWTHCLGGDKLCTCPCGKGLRPDFSPLRDERGRQCQPCVAAEAEQKEIDQADCCICWGTDFSGRSVCGVPCPVHYARTS